MDLVKAWFEVALNAAPPDLDIWDAHTHTGDEDPDGPKGPAQRLVEKLKQSRHGGAVVMTNRASGRYPQANDRILAEAEASDGVLIPYLRVDPNLGPAAVAEAERSLDRGHRGIKLHPRAESFRLSDDGVGPILRLAAERGVPVLCHAGRGIASLGMDAMGRCEEIDGLNLILAHAGISDLSWLGRRAAGIEGLYFDTSWWDVGDLLALFAWVPPGRIVHASDTPYSHPMLSFTLTMRCALTVGYGPRQLEGLFGGTLMGLLGGRPEDDLGEPPGTAAMAVDPGLLRLHSTLHRAVVRALARENVMEAASLARLGCMVPDDDEHAQLFAAVGATLDRIDPTATRGIARPLMILAAASLTPAAPVPTF